MNYNRVQLLRTIIDILQRVSNGARLAMPARDSAIVGPLAGIPHTPFWKEHAVVIAPH
jgi:hypothetical protein